MSCCVSDSISSSSLWLMLGSGVVQGLPLDFPRQSNEDEEEVVVSTKMSLCKT